ncbi:MAG: hypothetical protein MK108_04345 [Mariniblastus sp.]|nr:hypothetical protein [Mariniblastus sp.]
MQFQPIPGPPLVAADLPRRYRPVALAGQPLIRSLLCLAWSVGLAAWSGGRLTGQEPGSPEADGVLDRTAVVWQFGKTGAESESNGYYHLQFSPNGHYLAARNRDNLVEIHDIQRRVQLCEIGGHESRVLRVEFSPDSRFFVTSAPGVGEKTKVWETETGKLVKALPIDTVCARFSPDGRELILLGEREVHRYTWPGGTLSASRPWGNEADQPMTVTRDGQLVASYRSIKNQHYQCQVSDIQDDSHIMLDGPTLQPRSLLISDNQQWLAAIFVRDSKICIWDLNDPHQLKFRLEGHDQTVQSIAFSADNRFLVSTSWDKTSIVWDLLTRQPVKRIRGHSEYVNSSAFSPRGLQLATGASGPTDSSVILWDLAEFLFPRQPKPVTAESFAETWDALGSVFADKALNAVNDLRGSIEQIGPLVAERVGALNSMVSLDQLRAWIRDLDDPIFSVREKATLQLQKSRGPADALLQEALRATTSAEVRYRLTRILKTEVTRPKTSLTELRRLHRSVFLLELVNDRMSRKLLHSIATQHPHIDVARDAAAAMKRLETSSLDE